MGEATALVATLRLGRWDRERLREMAESYGTRATRALVEGALHETDLWFEDDNSPSEGL